MPAQAILMHIPDGFLSVPLSVLLWLVAIAGIGYALWRSGQDLGERQVPLMGVLAAVIFAGQMLNFSVTGGTSGHLVGGALAAILLGPWAAMLVMTSVVSIQALLFQDGGLLALGANLVNMAILSVWVGYAAYQTVQKLLGGRSGSVLGGGFVAGWLSIVISALAVALQLAVSGTSPANVAVPAMGGIHLLIGIGEGLITFGALAFLSATRRDLLKMGEARPAGSTAVWIGGLVLAALFAIASPLASSRPDGLEWVAGQKGFLTATRDPVYNLIPNYAFPGIGSEAVATILAGIVGVIVVFSVALAVAYARRHREAEA
ncbi:MAG: PDGLE domain-containing protein [Anaerolineae bacterium]|nr:PDGLE domain-containing protein [Anaerolineae bacterium]